MELSNVASERAVLAGICSYGIDCYLDVEAFLEDGTFTVDFNKVMYKCIKHTINKVDKIDFVSLLSAATDLSLGDYVNKPDVLKHFHGVLSTPIQLSGISGHAKKIRRLQFARHLQDTIKEAYKGLNEVSGEESLSDIVAMAEAPIQNASISYMKKDDNKPKLLGEGGMDYFEYLVSDEPKQVGVPSGFPSYDVAIGGGFLRKCVDLVGARTKAQPLTSKVLTPHGWTIMGDLKIGDEICHPSGSVSKITNILNKSKKECFEFIFDDGAVTEATGDHLWKVKHFRGEEYKVLSLDEIGGLYANNGKNPKWQFPIVEKVFFSSKSDFLISPYILGVLIGDGSIKRLCNFTCFEKEISDRVIRELPVGMTITLNPDRMAYRITTSPRLKHNPFTIDLKRLNLLGCGSHEKFIPREYLFSSEEDRLALLNGLLDTDGYVGESGSKEYATVSKQLMLDFCHLVRSLGGKTSVTYRTTTYTPEKLFYSYRINFSFNTSSWIFSLKRKSDRCRDRRKPDLKRRLMEVRPIGMKDVQCITIDNNDGLYITDDFIVTHNCGKSVLCDNVALHVSGRLNLPVLVLDTEMSEQDHWNRIWANISGIPINEIKTGDFKKDPMKRAAIAEARDKLASIPYFYINVSGKGFDEILSIARRWVLKEVGFEPTGRTKDCLIIYDYFKLMDSSGLSQNIAEFQAMGFQATKLHNFCVEHDVPCLSFVQLNRDGIEKESADVISQSDRIGWLCTSFTILKEKSIDEIADDGPRNGNRKLVPVLSRHGPGMSDDGYICLEMKGELARMREIGTVRRLSRSKEFPERPPEPESEDEG